MTAEQIVGLVVALLIMIGGTIGTLLPVIPGTPIIFIAAVAHRLYFGPHGADIWVLVLIGILAALAFVLDYIAGMVGARKMGATWRGVLGAVLGGLVGLLFSIPGILFGPFVGAVACEMLGGREFKPAAKAGFGATLGLVIGAVGKLALCFTMIILFVVNVIYRSGA